MIPSLISIWLCSESEGVHLQPVPFDGLVYYMWLSLVDVAA
jgi:hypothetical protein